MSRTRWILPAIIGTCLFSLATMAPQARAADPEVKPQPPFPQAVVLAGGPRDRGRAYGKEFSAGIHEFLETQVYGPLIRPDVTKEQMLAYAAACGKVTREVCPMVAEEIAGIAEGAGMTYEEIIMIHAHEELYHRRPLPYEGHCTAVAVSTTDSGDSHAYVGQTWDWMTNLAGVSRMTEWRRDDAPSTLAYGYPGMPVGAGLSSSGLALCWTSASLGNKKQSPRIGVPSYAMITHLLAQPDLDSAVREAERDKHAGWFTFVMADGQGNIANIEGSPDGVHIVRSTKHLGRAGYGIPEMLSSDKPGNQDKLMPRCTLINKLLDSTAGKNDRPTIMRYFTDESYQISSSKNPRNKTIDMMVFDTSSRKAYMSRGPAYGVEWREFGFGDTKSVSQK